MAIPKGTVIFAAPDDRQAFDDAVRMIKDRGYDKSQVRMFRENGSLLLELLVDIA